MPRGSEELTRAREEEIINACSSLYDTMSFGEITLTEISRGISFTRTSIYNYFQTKEEIFLALFKREYESWIQDLEELERREELSLEEFAQGLAETLQRRHRLLKLMSMNLYDMEANSRIEKLVDFKMAYAGSVEAVERCLEKFCPHMDGQGRRAFIYAFFPFMFGIYPYTSLTDKQRQAMEKAGIDRPDMGIYEIVFPFVKALLLGG